MLNHNFYLKVNSSPNPQTLLKEVKTSQNRPHWRRKTHTGSHLDSKTKTQPLRWCYNWHQSCFFVCKEPIESIQRKAVSQEAMNWSAYSYWQCNHRLVEEGLLEAQGCQTLFYLWKVTDAVCFDSFALLVKSIKPILSAFFLPRNLMSKTCSSPLKLWNIADCGHTTRLSCWSLVPQTNHFLLHLCQKHNQAAKERSKWMKSRSTLYNGEVLSFLMLLLLLLSVQKQKPVTTPAGWLPT